MKSSIYSETIVTLVDPLSDPGWEVSRTTRMKTWRHKVTQG